MFKYRLSALARLLVYHALAMVFLQGLLSAQVTLPPIIGDTLWTHVHADCCEVSPEGSGWGPWHAVAEDAGLLFRVTNYNILVHSIKNGLVVDRLGRWGEPRRIYSDRKGRKLVLQYLNRTAKNRDSLVTALMLYPEIKATKFFTFVGDIEWTYSYHASISPDGRWVVAPYQPSAGNTYMLYDTERDTSFVLKFGGTSRWSFDSASRQLAYANAVIDLSSLEPVVRFFPKASMFNNPKFSADGRYIIASTTQRKGLNQYPRISILDVATGEITWELHGSWDWTGGNGNMRDDLVSYAISGNGSLVYAYRNDTISGKAINEGFFYRLPDTIPIARSKPGTTGGFDPSVNTAGHVGYTYFSPDLTRCYVAASYPRATIYQCDLVAMRFDELVTSIPQGDATNPEQAALYPNPTTGVVTVRWEWPDETVHWQVVSATGQLVDYGSAMREGNAVRIVLANDLASGNYTLLVRDVLAEHVQQFTLVKN
jgi:hypothetical protein